MPANANSRRWLLWRAWVFERSRVTSACVLLVLAGLIEMHGLSGHGVDADNPMAVSMPASAAGGDGVRSGHTAPRLGDGRMTTEQAPGKGRLPAGSRPVAHAAVPASSENSENSHVAVLQGPNRHDPMGGMAAGLCLAMLAGLLFGLAVWLSAHRQRPLFEELLRRVPSPRPGGRDPDPPSPALLSVWRC